jgi:hypothetical protein
VTTDEPTLQLEQLAALKEENERLLAYIAKELADNSAKSLRMMTEHASKTGRMAKEYIEGLEQKDREHNEELGRRHKEHNDELAPGRETAR